jgi:hypothetical protein
MRRRHWPTIPLGRMKGTPNCCSRASAGPALFYDWPRTLFRIPLQRMAALFDALDIACGWSLRLQLAAVGEHYKPQRWGILSGILHSTLPLRCSKRRSSGCVPSIPVEHVRGWTSAN